MHLTVSPLFPSGKPGLCHSFKQVSLATTTVLPWLEGTGLWVQRSYYSVPSVNHLEGAIKRELGGLLGIPHAISLLFELVDMLSPDPSSGSGSLPT